MSCWRVWVAAALCLGGCGLLGQAAPEMAVHGGPVIAGAPGTGGAAYAAPAATVDGVLQDMAGRAAVIFSGMVTAVRWKGGTDADGGVASGVVEVEFQVETAVRGVAAGQVYVVREWAGLWRDAPRFQVGQRRLMLLHAQAPGGMSSPVDGLDGAIPVGGATAAWVDLRWVEAKTLRRTGVRVRPYAVTAAVGVQPAQILDSSRVDLGSVLTMLAAWEAASDASR